MALRSSFKVGPRSCLLRDCEILWTFVSCSDDNSVPAAECARPGADLAPGILPVPRLPRGVRRQHVLPGEGDVREESRV